MPFKTFLPDDLAAALGMARPELDQLLAAGLVKPAAVTGEEGAVYDQAGLEELRALKGLLDLGYDISEVGKIARKIGMPSSKRGRARGTSKLLTVGELARRADINPRTIKYWEELEILTPEAYSDGGFRLYTQDYVLFCQLIKDLQVFGYSLKEIKDTADLFRTFSELSSQPGNAATPAAVAAFGDMLARIDELRARMQALREGIRRWEGFTDKYGKQIARLKSQAERRLKTAAPDASAAPAPADTDPKENPS